MTRKKSEIPITTVYRLSYYYRGLLAFTGPAFISSSELAELTGFSDALVRRDLTYFGRFGTPGKGYKVVELKKRIAGILNINRKWKVALIGLGNLGSALLKYKGFERQGFEIVSIFDNDPKKTGKRICGTEIHNINRFSSMAKEKCIEMVILAVPAAPAQKIVDIVVKSGVEAILNFAPVHIKVLASVSLVNIDMSVELEKLAFLTTGKEC